MRSAFALLLIIFAAHIVAAQDDIPDNPLFPKPRPKRFFLGPMVGYNSNYHSGGFRTLGAAALADPSCGDFTTGGGNGIMAGLAAEYWFKPGGPTALQLRAYYEQKPGNFTNVTAPLPFFDPVTNQVVYFTRTLTVDAKINLFNVEVQYKYNLPHTRFGVALGPKFGFLMSSDYVQVQKLNEPGFVFQETGTNTQTLVPSGPIAGASSFRLGLVAHIQYELLAGPFLVTPRILYDLAVTKVTGSWAVSSLAGTVEIKYGF